MTPQRMEIFLELREEKDIAPEVKRNRTFAKTMPVDVDSRRGSSNISTKEGAVSWTRACISKLGNH